MSGIHGLYDDLAPDTVESHAFMTKLTYAPAFDLGVQELDHDNIVQLLALLKPSQDEMVLVEEAIEGPSLASLLEKQETLPCGQTLYSDKQATRWMIHLASALHYMQTSHTGKIFVHRDISTANTMLTTYNFKKAQAKLVRVLSHSAADYMVYSSILSAKSSPAPCRITHARTMQPTLSLSAYIIMPYAATL